MSTIYWILIVVAILDVIFACVWQDDQGTYEDEQRRLADKMIKKKKKDKGR